MIVKVPRADRYRLEVIVSDRSAPQKHVCGGPTSSSPLPTAVAPPRSAPSGKSKPVDGDGRPGSWRRASKVDARQDAQARKPPLPTGTVQRWSTRRRAAAGRNNSLDRPDAGESRRASLAFGATYSSVPARAVSYRTFKLSNDPVRRELKTLSALMSTSRRCGRPLGRRKEPDTGARPYPARVADEAGPRGTMTRRLHVMDHHAVRRRTPQRHRHRPHISAIATRRFIVLTPSRSRSRQGK